MTAYVLTVRTSKGENTYTTVGDVHVIDLDLTHAFTDRPGDYATACDLAYVVTGQLDAVDVDSPIYTEGIAVLRAALRDWDRVLRIVDEYEQLRRREP